MLPAEKTDEASTLWARLTAQYHWLHALQAALLQATFIAGATGTFWHSTSKALANGLSFSAMFFVIRMLEVDTRFRLTRGERRNVWHFVCRPSTTTVSPREAKAAFAFAATQRQRPTSSRTFTVILLGGSVLAASVVLYERLFVVACFWFAFAVLGTLATVDRAQTLARRQERMAHVERIAADVMSRADDGA